MVNENNLFVVTDKIENSAEIADNIIKQVVANLTSGLDTLVDAAWNQLATNQLLTDKNLEYYILMIPAELYYINASLEELGVRDDIAKLLRNQIYQQKKQDAQGSISNKESVAEMAVSQENFAALMYTRAYKQVKAKIDAAYELLNSLKKVASRRMLEFELSNSKFTDGGSL